jgi:hypothetical protein
MNHVPAEEGYRITLDSLFLSLGGVAGSLVALIARWLLQDSAPTFIAPVGALLGGLFAVALSEWLQKTKKEQQKEVSHHISG